jgi:predicted DnaQ family exonuclease/DinG family helicase
VSTSPAQFIDDPDWARFIPELKASAQQRHLPTHEDCAQLDPDDAAMHLKSGGTLGRMNGYEERAGQIDMLSAIVRSFNNREHLMVEAGTGVGKSLAYLIPSILWAWTNDTPVVVSTATRNLQSQLISSDIPKALAALGENAGRFKVALLKGRTNYLCLRAVGEFFSAGYWTMSEEEQRLAGGFIDFIKSTPDGDLDGYDGIRRELITSTGEECAMRRCPFYSKCFVRKARKAAAEAHLIVVNHALVLADSISSGGILPGFSRLVFDEAHNLENIATEYLKREFSLPALSRIFSKLIRRRTHGRTARAHGVIAQLERQLNKGLLKENAVREILHRQIATLTGLTVKATNQAKKLQDAAMGLLSGDRERQCCRYKFDDGRRMHSVHGLFKPYEPEKWDESRLASAHNALEAELAAIVKTLMTIAETIDGSVEDGELNYLGDISAQARTIAGSIVEFANDTNFVIRADKSSHAYWAETINLPRQEGKIRLVAAPLSVAEELRKTIYETKDSVVLCSATLRIGNDFRYMSRRLGCDERFSALTAESPFNYLMQSLVLAAEGLPDPSIDPPRYAEALAQLMKRLFSATRGRSLVLFTSYEMMRSVAAAARSELEREGITLLVQGEGLSRESMTQRLKTGERTVIFGSQSFWEGVDVAGEALSCVVISRLPFAQVGDPVIEARSEKIERDGGSAFRDYALPEAVIKFRQGFGRLIRTKSDRGVVIVTDPRIVTKNYGAFFRKSIPASIHTAADEAELVSRVEEFFV